MIFKSHVHKLLEIKLLQNSIYGRLSRRRHSCTEGCPWVRNHIRHLSDSRRSCGVDLGEMISLEETERNLKTTSSWVHLPWSARREIAQGLLTRASGRTRLNLRLHCFCDRSTSLATKCPASVTSVRQPLRRRLSNQRFTATAKGGGLQLLISHDWIDEIRYQRRTPQAASARNFVDALG